MHKIRNILAELEIRTHLKLDATEGRMKQHRNKLTGRCVRFVRAKPGEQKEAIVGGGGSRTRVSWKVLKQIEDDWRPLQIGEHERFRTCET